ncbi:peptidoglycan binding protein CsiV [Pseudomonas stutzeri]|nr:peptidoglycan binding protein CsiV [Stutzerimonas stutzeri]
MSPLRRLLLLLVLCAPPACADALYRIELILFRHAEPLEASRRAPYDWAHNARLLANSDAQPADFEALAARLDSGDGYRVLLRQTWRQRLDERVAVVEGARHLEHFPVQGVIALRLRHGLEVDARFWVNRFGEYGRLLASEQLQQRVQLRPGELRYIDHGSLGALIRASY